MAAGQITIDLLLKSGSFEQNTQRASKATRKFKQDVDELGKSMGLAIGAGAALAAAGFAKMFTESTAAIDAFNDLRDATGASIENISAIDRVARETGVTFETVEASLVKLNQALNAAKPDSDTARALEAIGLSAKDLKSLDPAEALRRVAVALSGYADDGSKARIVQELFGKSLKEVAPLLVDLAKKNELVASTTTDEAQAVEDFRKKSFALRADIEDLARAFTIKLIPSIQSATGELKSLFGVGPKTKDTIGTEVSLLEANLAKLKGLEGKGFTIAGFFGSEAARNVEIQKLESDLKNARERFRVAAGLPEDFSNEGRNTPKPSANMLDKAPKVRTPKADRPFTGLNYDEQITQKVGHLFENSDLIKAKEFTDQIAKLDELFFSGGISGELYDSALKKLTGSTSTADKATSEFLDRQQRLGELLGATPTAELERQRADMLLLTDAFNRGAISVEQYTEAARTRLGTLSETIQKTKESFQDLLGDSFTDPFADFISGAKSAKDAAADFLSSLSRNLAQLASRDIADQLFGTSKGARGGGFDFSSIGSYFSNLFGGFFAEGGAPPMGKVSVVGENGPELFVPRTAGSIVPLDKAPQSSRADRPMQVSNHFTISGPVDRRTQQQIAAAAGRGVARALGRDA